MKSKRVLAAGQLDVRATKGQKKQGVEKKKGVLANMSDLITSAEVNIKGKPVIKGIMKKPCGNRQTGNGDEFGDDRSGLPRDKTKVQPDLPEMSLTGCLHIMHNTLYI